MVRENRIIYEGAIYHITQRGNNREYVFKSPKSKSFFIKQVKEYNKKFDFQLLAYAVMDNHYHLLIKTNKDPIDKIMFNINNVVGKYLNRELKRTGHIFEKRYNSELVDTDAYLIWLLRYIHRNPVRAHICNSIEDYRWTGHFFYKHGINSFVNINFILKIISSNKFMAIKQYLDLVNFPEAEDNPQTDYTNFKQKYNLSENYLSNADNQTICNIVKSLEEIMVLVSVNSKIVELLKAGSKKRILTPYKIQFIKIALENKYTLKEIGEFLNISQPAISLYIKQQNIKF